MWRVKNNEKSMKTKYVIAVVAVLLVTGMLWFWYDSQSGGANMPSKQWYSSQQACEAATGKVCSYGMCENNCEPGEEGKGYRPVEE